MENNQGNRDAPPRVNANCSHCEASPVYCWQVGCPLIKNHGSWSRAWFPHTPPGPNGWQLLSFERCIYRICAAHPTEVPSRRTIALFLG